MLCHKTCRINQRNSEIGSVHSHPSVHSSVILSKNPKLSYTLSTRLNLFFKITIFTSKHSSSKTRCEDQINHRNIQTIIPPTLSLRSATTLRFEDCTLNVNCILEKLDNGFTGYQEDKKQHGLKTQPITLSSRLWLDIRAVTTETVSEFTIQRGKGR